MKTLLATKVQRKENGPELNEWTPAADHLTDDGRDSFRKRMLDRIAAADKARKDATSKAKWEAAANVRNIKGTP